MTVTFPVFDKQGVLLLRTFPDVAHLPASPTPGQMCCVDTGSVTSLYQALRGSGGTVQWDLVATPLIVIEVDPSDSRLIRFSVDGGVTWSFEAFKSTNAVTNNPQSGSENVIESIGGVTNPLNVIGSNGNAFLATGVGVPGIQVRADDAGSTTAPALHIFRTPGTTSPVVVDFEIEGDAPIPLVQQDGALVSYSVGALPTASARWLQCIVYVTHTTLADGGAFICIRLHDGSYTWKSIIFAPTPTPSGQLGLYPALPARGGSPVVFVFAVLFQGTPLPWIVPLGWKVHVDLSPDMWGYDNGTNTYFTTLVGSDLYNVSGFPVGRLIFSAFAIDAGGKVTSTLGVTDGLVDFTATQDCVLLLAGNSEALLSAPPTGNALITLTVTPPDFDVTITTITGTIQAHCNFGDTIPFDASTPGFGFFNLTCHFSVAVQLEILDLSNYTNGTSDGNTMVAKNATIPGSDDPHSWDTWYSPFNLHTGGTSTPSGVGANPVGLVLDGIQAFEIASNGTEVTGHLKITAP